MSVFSFGPWTARPRGCDRLSVCPRVSHYFCSAPSATVPREKPTRILRLERAPGRIAPGRGGPEASLLSPATIALRFPGWSAEVSREDAHVRFAAAPEDPAAADRFFDPILMSVGMAWTLLEGGLLLHASGVTSEAGAFLFPGRSGLGKSTTAKLLGREAVVLSDDQTVVYPAAGHFAADTAVITNGRPAPVAGIFFIRRGAASARRALSAKQALVELLRNVILWNSDRGIHDLVLKTAGDIVQRVPCWRLSVCLDDIRMNVLTGGKLRQRPS